MDSNQILKQFNEEAPSLSLYHPPKYLKHFCKEHRKYIWVPSAPMGKIEKRFLKENAVGM